MLNNLNALSLHQRLLLISVLFMVILNNPVLANDESGCLVKTNKSLKIDEECSCLKNNTCAKFKKFEISESLLRQVDTNNRPLFNSTEKSKLRESVKIYDKIIKARLAGKANSDEIRSLYLELDRLNLETRKSLLKTQAKFLSKSKPTYEKNISQIKSQRKKIFASSLDNSGIKNSPSSASAPVETIETKVIKTPPKEESHFINDKTNTRIEMAEKNAESDKIDADNEIILKNLKPDKLNRNEEDSLFDIITKSYMKSAYPKLLKPKEK